MCQQGTDTSQQRCLKQCDGKELFVAELCLRITLHEQPELRNGSRFLLFCYRQWFLLQLIKLLTLFEIHVMPSLRTHLAFVRELSLAVHGTLLDDVQHYLWIHIATGRTGTCISVSIVGCCLEICDSLDRITVKDRISASVQHPQSVEEFIHIAGWLVDICYHKATMIGLLLQQQYHHFRIGRREA